MPRQIIITGDDKDELIAELQNWLTDLGAEGPTAADEPEAEEETVEEETEETTEDEPEVEVEDEDPMAELRNKLIEKIRVMSKKGAGEVEKIRAAFKKNGVKKFDDNTPDSKLPALAKALGVK